MAAGAFLVAFLLAVGLQYLAAVAIYLDVRRHDLGGAAGYYLGTVYVPFVGLVVALAYLHERPRLHEENEKQFDG